VAAFYRKLGFQAVGEEFMEAGISHVRMAYQRYDKIE
jgi:predicted GNAT family N-acyltransferase